MGKNFVNILGVKVSTLSKEEALEEIKKYLEKIQNPKSKIQNPRVKPLVIFTPNPEIIVYSQKNEEFRQILNQADLCLPDGWGVLWASRIIQFTVHSSNHEAEQSSLHGPEPNSVLVQGFKEIKERISGVEFMESLCRLAAEQSLRVGLIGGREGVALRSLECLQKQFPNLKGWAENGPQVKVQSSNHEAEQSSLHGPEPNSVLVQGFKVQSSDRADGGRPSHLPGGVAPAAHLEGESSSEVEKWSKKIVNDKTAILFVGLGWPKQEYFISAVSCKLSAVSCKLVLMSVGGAFDELSGRIPRCPKFIDDLGFKWLWRLIIEPWRLPRQLCLIKFIFLVAATRLGKKV